MPASGSVQVWAIGGPTAVLDLGGVRLLTDPTFSEPGEYRSSSGAMLVKTEAPAAGPDQIGSVDAVLLSHDQHPDNLDDAGRALLARVPRVLSTASAHQRLGGTVEALPSWTSTTLPRPGGAALTVTGVPAQHGPDGCEPIVGEVTGFVLSGEGLPTVYVSGDNASLPVVSAVADRCGPIDIALLFAGAARTALFDGANLTLTSDQAAEAAKILGAREVVPVHFRGWGHFTEDGEALRRSFSDAGLVDRLRLLRPGERVSLLP